MNTSELIPAFQSTHTPNGQAASSHAGLAVSHPSSAGASQAPLLDTQPAPIPAVPYAGRPQKETVRGRRLGALVGSLVSAVLPPACGLGLLVLIWAIVSSATGNTVPGPVETWHQAVEVFRDPFYHNGPNDQGVGWNVLASLQRVAIGFGLAALVGIPAGFVIGRFDFLSRMFNPLISLLRPVSPLAWLPIGLLVFKGANPAAIWTIFICSIWPMIINTAVGVQRVPQDYMNVARVLNLSEWKIATTVLFPAVLPYMLTGVRLAVGTAWLVIVAAEMLTGGVGIGFWVWDEWNNLNVKNIIVAIFVIGIVGLVLEMALVKIATAFTFEEVKS
ncbi:nitrate ABC transporter permease [Ottowia thiooxydans]|uniref:nitrate ABC transporter permease n=1 Tax=Ottowia thiooxydans TaxID=219182 RepID=UPI000401E272|nr:nitrate ABC transporter permease [Ottowia thiooxydans]